MAGFLIHMFCLVNQLLPYQIKSRDELMRLMMTSINDDNDDANDDDNDDA